MEEHAEQWRLIPAYLKTRGMAKPHITSFNYLVETELQQIVDSDNLVRSEVFPEFYLKYHSIWVGEPEEPGERWNPRAITPMECRLRDLTYAAPVRVKVEYFKMGGRTGGKGHIVQNVFTIGYLPIMLRSNSCVLSKCKTDEDFAKVSECPKDPGGYFIVNGNEKVLLIQEQLVNNRILVEIDKKDCVRASVTSSTHQRKSQTALYIKGHVLYLKHNNFVEDIPAVIMLKAMGIESDQEAIMLAGLENSDIFSISIEHSKQLNVITRERALHYIGKRVRVSMAFKTRLMDDREKAMEALCNVVLSHIPVKDFDLYEKSIYLTIMIRRVLYTFKNPGSVDDRDYYGNKRLEMAGQLISLLFEDLFKRFNWEFRKAVDKELSSKNASTFDAQHHFNTRTITQGLNNAILTGNWNIKRFRMERAGITQEVTRLSFIASLGTMTRISSHFEKTRKISGPRSLQPSQWGMMCPSDTPEGENCGLVKHLALMAHVTTDSDDRVLRNVLLCLGIEDIKSVPGYRIFAPDSYMVFLNGVVMGIHSNPYKFVKNFKHLRRCGKITAFASIYIHEVRKSIYISSDGGRVCRPLIIVENGRPRIEQVHLDKLHAGILHFDDLLRMGLVEFLDVNEENDGLIALRADGIGENTTHLEIDPLTILGVCAGLIPYPHHNQSPRNTYQSVMGKQAMGAIGYNQLRRIEALIYLLVYPMRPMVKTRTIEFIGFEDLPAGHNATVAVMSYSGYDIEDASILNRSSVDRGYGRCMALKKFSTVIKSYRNGAVDRIVAPGFAGPNSDRRTLDVDGLARVGEIIRSGDVLVNKEVPLFTSDLNVSSDSKKKGAGAKPTKEQAYSPFPTRYKGPCIAVVDQVMLSTNEQQQFLIKINMRSTRRPELGDKFSSRHGQKGVCGLIVNQEDMPFSDSGICPDVIMNPHGFPSRMTVGKMIELLAGKSGVLEGKHKYGTAFGGDSVDACGAVLAAHGFSFVGKDYMTSGITGEPLSAYIFMGPVFYQKLKHMVMDKIHARSRGPRSQLTRQPTEGRAREGGLRLGEMERDCLIGYGASLLLQERLMFSSDAYQVFVCERCGVMGHENRRGERWCQPCGSGSAVVPIEMPYACKLLLQELMSMSILPRLRLVSL